MRKLVFLLATIFVIGLTFFSGPAIEDTTAPSLVATAIAAEGMVPPGYAWHGNLDFSLVCLPNGNTGYEVTPSSQWEPFDVEWSGDPPSGELSPGGSASGWVIFTWPGGEKQKKHWSVDAKNCPQPTEKPQCTVENFDLKIVKVVEVNDTRAEVQAEITWDNGPNSAFIVWDFPGGRTDVYDRGGLATWELDRLDADYTVTVRAYIIEDETQCGSDSEEATIPARPKIPTPTPTKEPTPTPTEPPEECEKADSVVFGSNNATFNRPGGDKCINWFAVYNTHGFSSLQEPGAFQTLIGYSAGESQTLEVLEYDPEEGCNVQLDAGVANSWEEIPTIIPEKLTNENQGPQWESLIRAETRGDHVCDDKPPGDPDKVCPICPRNRVDENNHPVTDVKIVKPVVLPCEVIWDEDKGEYCLTLDYPDGHVLRGWRQGPAFNLQLTGNEFWVTRTYTGADGLEYSSFRKVAPTGYKFIYWNGETPGEERLREDGTEVFEYWGPCSVTVGYHDTELIDGVAYGYWWEGHNVWEWKKFLTDEGYFDNWSDADAWAQELRLQGIGGRLELPEKPTAASQLEEDAYSLSPDGSREAFLRNGNLWIRWTVERSDGFPQEWDTGVAAESVDSWDTNWVITITQDGESYQTDQFASFLNLVEFET